MEDMSKNEKIWLSQLEQGPLKSDEMSKKASCGQNPVKGGKKNQRKYQFIGIRHAGKYTQPCAEY